MTVQASSYTGPGLGERLLQHVLLSFASRAALALGGVLGVALLGALAFTTRTDLRVVWFDETGRLAIGLQRTTTQAELDRVIHELTETKRRLEAEQARPSSPSSSQAGANEEAVRRAELKTREAEKLVERAQRTIVEQGVSIDILKRRIADLDQFRAVLVATAVEKDREIKRLDTQLKAAPKPIEYRAVLDANQGYLPLRDKPERASRILKTIPPGGAVQTSCKLVAVEDAVFVKSVYQGVTGWVSSFYLRSANGR